MLTFNCDFSNDSAHRHVLFVIAHGLSHIPGVSRTPPHLGRHQKSIRSGRFRAPPQGTSECLGIHYRPAANYRMLKLAVLTALVRSCEKPRSRPKSPWPMQLLGHCNLGNHTHCQWLTIYLQSTESSVSNIKNLQCAVSVVCNLGPGPGPCSQLGSGKQLSNCLPGYLFLTVLQLKSKLWSLGAAQLHEMALPSTKADLGRVELKKVYRATEGSEGRLLLKVCFFPCHERPSSRTEEATRYPGLCLGLGVRIYRI